jgi:hypothetical protein
VARDLEAGLEETTIKHLAATTRGDLPEKLGKSVVRELERTVVPAA